MARERNIDWQLLEQAVKEKGWTERQLAMAMGQSSNYIATSKHENGMPTEKVVQAELILGLKEGSLLKQVEQTTIELPESDFEKDVRADLKEIKEAINLLMEVVGNIEANAKPKKIAKPALQQAKELLNRMLADIGSCKYEEYKSHLKTIGISPDIAEEAIKSCQCITSTTGYGKKTCKWITRTRDGGIYKDSDVKVVGE